MPSFSDWFSGPNPYIAQVVDAHHNFARSVAPASCGKLANCYDERYADVLLSLGMLQQASQENLGIWDKPARLCCHQTHVQAPHDSTNNSTGSSLQYHIPQPGGGCLAMSTGTPTNRPTAHSEAVALVLACTCRKPPKVSSQHARVASGFGTAVTHAEAAALVATLPLEALGCPLLAAEFP